MGAYNLSILEDESVYISIIKEKLDTLFPNFFIIKSYENISELQKDSETNMPAILLADIKLKEGDSIDYSSYLANNFPNTQIIFISAYDSYIQDIFKANPVYFVKKPIDDSVLETAINKALNRLKKNEPEYLTVKSNSEITNIPLQDIMFLESNRRIVICHYKDNKISFYGKLDSIEKNLNDDFVRCHQSFIINMNEIKSITSTDICLKSNNTIPISKNKQKLTRDQYALFLANKLSNNQKG